MACISRGTWVKQMESGEKHPSKCLVNKVVEVRGVCVAKQKDEGRVCLLDSLLACATSVKIMPPSVVTMQHLQPALRKLANTETRINP